MRTIGLVLALLTTFNLSAQQIKIDAGSLIIHTKYSQKLGYLVVSDSAREGRYKTELVKTPYNRVVLRSQIGITYLCPVGVNKYYEIGAFVGEDCLHGPIIGIKTGFGWQWKYFKVGITAGGYKHDGDLWRKNHFKGRSFIPLVGASISIKKDFKRWGVELCNNLTPLMTVHQISINYKL